MLAGIISTLFIVATYGLKMSVLTTSGDLAYKKFTSKYKFASFTGTAPPFSPKSDSQNSFSDQVIVGDMKVSSVGAGTIAWFGGDNPATVSDIDSLVAEAVTQNCNFFDTAERYGSGITEALGGGWGGGERLLQSLPKAQLKVATKFTPTPWRFDADSVVKSCENSCKRLGVKSLDLYQIHMPDIVQPFRGVGYTNRKDEVYWEGLAECYRRGLAKNVGVSNYGPTLLIKAQERLARRNVPLASNQINFSLLYRNTGSQQAVDIANSMGVRTIAYYPLAMGLLTGKHSDALKTLINNASWSETAKTKLELSELRGEYQDILPLLMALQRIASIRGKTIGQVALNWIICKGALPIPGARNVRQLRENLGARGWRLTKVEQEMLEGVSDELNITFDGAGFKRSSEKFVGYGLEGWKLD